MAASFYGRSRLPFASPQNSPNPPLQLPGATQAAADLSCSSNKSLRPWQCPFKEVQGWFASLQNSPKLPKPSPAAPRRHSGRGRPFLQLQQVPEAVAASFYGRSRLPFASPQNSPNPPVQLPGATQAAADLSCSSNKSLSPWQCPFKEVQGWFASLQNSPKLPKPPLQLPGATQATQAAADLSCSSNKSLRAWQRLFMDVQGCRLPAFKTPQAPRRHSGRGRPFLQLQQVPEAVAVSFYGGSRLPLASIRNSPNSPNPPLQLPGATQAAADLSCSSNKSLRPWQRLFMDVQGCRLPALKTPQTLPCSSQAPLRPRQTFPAAPTSPWGRGSVLLRRFKAGLPAFKTRQNSPNPPPSPAAPRRHSGRGRPFLQLQQVPEAVAASFYGRSRLPFASPQNSPNPPLQLPGATQAAADLSCSSNKSLRPWQRLFMDVQGCRLPALKTPQTLPCSSQAPLRPRQTFPAAPTSPWGRGSVLLRRFKAGLPAFKTRQNSPNPPLQLPGATQAAADLSCSSNKSLRAWQCLFMDVQGCRLPAFKTPQAPRRHSGRGRPFLQLQQVPEAVAVSFYGGSRLPLASIRNSPNSPNPPLQLPGATQAAADLSCSSNKSLRPWQRLFMDVQGCRLPALKTPQTLPCSSQAPLRPRQTFPAAPTSPWGRGSVLLRRFKAGLPAFKTRQNSPNPPLQLPGATQAAADLSCSSNKSLRPWQRLFMDVQGCRLPALKTPQTLPCSSQAPLQQVPEAVAVSF